MNRFVFVAAVMAAGVAFAHHREAPLVMAHHHDAPVVLAHDHQPAVGGKMVPASGPAAAAALGPIAIEGAFARAAVNAGGTSAAYLTVSIAEGSDTLLAAASPAAAKVELHTHTLDDRGVARMRQVPGIAVEAGSATVLAPGGLHVMLMGLTAPLEPGATLPLTLTFEHAGSVTLDVPVRGMARRPMTN